MILAKTLLVVVCYVTMSLIFIALKSIYDTCTPPPFPTDRVHYTLVSSTEYTHDT